jgi:hypothetical protein
MDLSKQNQWPAEIISDSMSSERGFSHRQKNVGARFSASLLGSLASEVHHA